MLSKLTRWLRRTINKVSIRIKLILPRPARTCETCRYFHRFERSGNKVCLRTLKTTQLGARSVLEATLAESERKLGDCGPRGKLWEAK